jgi:hypothetical protein
VNGTTYRRAPGPVPELPQDDVRPVRDDDNAALAALFDQVWSDGNGAAHVDWWRLHGVPGASFVAGTDSLVAACLVSWHKGKFWIGTVTAPAGGDFAAPVVAASLRALKAPVLANVDDDSTARLLIGLGFTTEQDDLPVLVVDGSLFSDFEGFAREFTKLLDDYTWSGNLDAFNDILRGGFGTPELGWIFRWLHHESSREALGYGATIRRLERMLLTCHPDNRERVAARIESAKRGEGPTLFDEIVEIIRVHGPGGEESEDNVILELR